MLRLKDDQYFKTKSVSYLLLIKSYKPSLFYQKLISITFYIYILLKMHILTHKT